MDRQRGQRAGLDKTQRDVLFERQTAWRVRDGLAKSGKVRQRLNL